jgi:hypothetical protein
VIAPDEGMRASLCFVLEAEGYAVGLADSPLDLPSEALVADCVIVDEAALSRARASGVDFGTTPVVVLSEQAERPSLLGRYALVQKPLLGQALIDIVQALLPGRNLPGLAATT